MGHRETQTTTGSLIWKTGIETQKELMIRAFAQELIGKTLAESLGPFVDSMQIAEELRRGNIGSAGEMATGAGYGAILGYYAGDLLAPFCNKCNKGTLPF